MGRAGSVPPSIVACFQRGVLKRFFCSWAWSYPAGFILPFPPPLPLFPLFSSVWQVPGWLPVRAHGWDAGIASHGSVSQSRGWLISVEAPRHPGHLSSIQLDAVVNLIIQRFSFFISISFYKGLLKISNASNMRPFGYSYINTALRFELNRKYKTEFLTILALSNNLCCF